MKNNVLLIEAKWEAHPFEKTQGLLGGWAIDD